MQHRYRVMKYGWMDYAAQVQPLESDPDTPAHWAQTKRCTTRWGAIWACKKHAAGIVELEARKLPVWTATLPPTPGMRDEDIEADNAAFNR